MSARAALNLARDMAPVVLPEVESADALLRPFELDKVVRFPIPPEQTELESQTLAHQLAVARRIQESLLARTFTSLPGFDLAGFCRSAHQLGGDFYDVLPLSPHSLLLVVADVMGKGVPAALFTSSLRTLVRTLSQWERDPGHLLAQMNRLMFEELSLVDMFITVQVVVVDSRRRTLVLANAGHCPLLLTDGLTVTKALAPEGPPLGILPTATFAEHTVSLDEFTSALLYTDGLTESRDPEGELFGQSRLETWLGRNARTNETAAQLKERFLDDLTQFQAGPTPPDDQTFLLLIHRPALATSNP